VVGPDRQGKHCLSVTGAAAEGTLGYRWEQSWGWWLHTIIGCY